LQIRIRIWFPLAIPPKRMRRTAQFFIDFGPENACNLHVRSETFD
jgi:hypothetical protein